MNIDVPSAIAVECAAAIPPERREAAIMACLARTHAHFAIQLALALAERFDLPPLATLVIDKSERSYPHNRKAERAKLQEIAARQPRIAAVVKERLGRPRPKVSTPTRQGSLAGDEASTKQSNEKTARKKTAKKAAKKTARKPE